MAATSLLGLTGQEEVGQGRQDRQGRGRQASGKWLVDGHSGHVEVGESYLEILGAIQGAPKVPPAALCVTCNDPGGTRPGQKRLWFPVWTMVA